MTSGLGQYDIFTADDFESVSGDAGSSSKCETEEPIADDRVKYVVRQPKAINTTAWDDTDVSDSDGFVNANRLTIFGALLVAVAGLVIFFTSGGFTPNAETSSGPENNHHIGVDRTPVTSSGR